MNSTTAEEPVVRHFLYQFDKFQLDPANRLLTADGREVVLPGKAFDVLVMLLEHPGTLLSKERLLSVVWSGSFVEEANLTVAISAVRRALNDDPTERRYIQTVPRQGYRFIAEVRQLPSKSARQDQTPGPMEGVLLSANAAPTVVTMDAPSRRFFAKRAWPAGLLAVALIAAIGAGSWMVVRPVQPLHTMAVLPISESAATGASSVDPVVLLGITDTLIAQLGDRIRVRPTSSVLQYLDVARVDPVTAGREQRVDVVLAGTLTESKDVRSLHLRLVRVNDGMTLWQKDVRAPQSDLTALEAAAAEAAGRELAKLGADPGPTANQDSQLKILQRANDTAYQLYLRGRYFWNRRTVDGLERSSELFKQSIQADPNYAPAYAGLADSYALLASFSVKPGGAASVDARSAALSAIQLDPTLAEPHASLGMIYFFTDWDLPAAQREFERAIALDPDYATAHHWYALDLAAMGLRAQSLYEIHLAQKLDPLSLIIGTNVGWIEYLAGDNAAALHDLHRVLELDPNFARARTRLGIVEMTMGDNTEAIRDLGLAVSLSGDEDPWVVGLLGDAQARSGNRAAAERTLAELVARSRTQYVPPISRAMVQLGLGEKSAAISALQQAAEDHSTAMVYARVDPLLDGLRSEPAFQALMARIRT